MEKGKMHLGSTVAEAEASDNGKPENSEEESSERPSVLNDGEKDSEEVTKKKKKKNKNKKKKELPQQTDPPSIPVTDVFPSGLDIKLFKALFEAPSQRE